MSKAGRALTKKEIMASAAKDKYSLGNLVVQEGLLTNFELGKFLEEFRGLVDTLLGQFLVEKGVFSEEKLQLILNRQDAMRNGGIEHKHVMIAMNLAEKTQERFDSCSNELLASASGFAAKTGG